jgi:hypothetical protein
MKKRTRRKVWNLLNPVQHAIDGAMIVPQELLMPLRLRELGAIEAFRTGTAGLQEWHDLNAMHGLCETMARENIGPEALEACELCETYLIEAARRFERMGKMGTSGPGLQAFRDVYEFHDLQRTSVARATYDRMIRLATARIRSQAPGVTVL